MKRILLILLLICGLSGMVAAQVMTNPRILGKMAVDFQLAGEANLQKAFALAKERGWPLAIKGKEGKVAILTGVDFLGMPSYTTTFNNTIAAATTRANQLWPGGASGLNLTGSSANMKNKIAVWDEGAVLGTHVELTGRVTQKDNPSSVADHSTHVSGTMMASGVNPSAKGMAYGLQGLIAYDFQNFTTEMASEAANLVISNHSYGNLAGWSYNDSQSRWEFYGQPNSTEDYKFGFYNDVAQSLDDISFNAPNYLIVFSAGNKRTENGPAVGSPYFRLNSSGQMISAGNRPDGISSNNSYDVIPTYNGAKNVLTVGAVSGISGGYSRPEDVIMSNFSSWGPTDDGRIKPDIVADGVNVVSPIATSTNSYASFSGTSMSSPNAAGSLFLLQEYYSKLKAGAFLRAATLKGLAIHTAEEAGTSPGPDYQFGWGLLNVEKAAAVITAAVPSNNAANSAHLLYENTLNNGATFSTSVIASGKGPIVATISWTDPKGTVDNVNLLNSRTKKLVNDLDIRVTANTAGFTSTYFPWTLDVNNPSFPAVVGDNSTDNVERINITDSTIPGKVYTITVSHKGTLANNLQAYSLLVSGTGGVAYCASASGGGGARIDSVSFKSIKKANTSGSKTYTNNTNLVADIEPSESIPVFVKVGTADATANSRIVKVFIDFNNNGVFDSNELAGTSTVIAAASGNYAANLTMPSTLTIGNILLMRVIVQETSNAGDINACGTYGKGETQDYRLRVVTPTNDMSITEIISPAALDCSSGAQYVTIRVKNNGSVIQKNVPLSVTIGTGGSVIANLSANYPDTIPALSTVAYTFQTPIVTNGGTAYTLTATVNLSNDQFTANNQLVAVIATSPKPAAVSGIGGICTTTAILKVNNPDASNYFWYATPGTGTPFASGANTSTTTIPTDKTYYLAKEARASIGAANKMVFTSGGYNSFSGNYVKFNNTVPINIETARMYISYPGKIKFTVANLITTNADGSFTYQPISNTTVDVYATSPTPTPGASTGNNAADSGAVFNLNLPVTPVGDHIIIIESLDRSGNRDQVNNLGASIFRNNGISTTNTYPLGVTNIASITGNSANTGGAQESQFYYFFYDMRINTGGCVGDRVPVVATISPTPTISQVGDSLVSSASAGNQWYLNDTALNNSTSSSQKIKPSKPGTYKVIVTDQFGCTKTSNTINITVTAVVEVLAREIKLAVSPNPNNGVFNLSFEVTSRADLSIDLLSASGQRVFNSSVPNFTGKYSRQISIGEVSGGFYILKILHNKKTYVQKVLIQR